MIVIPILQSIYFLHRHMEFHRRYKISQLYQCQITMDLGLNLGPPYSTLSTEAIINLNYLRSVKYEWIKFKAVGKPPYHKSLAIKSLWLIQSNTLENSINNAPNSCPLFTDFINFSNIASRQCWELYSLQNPHWLGKSIL